METNKITETSEHIKIEGWRGKWSVIDTMEDTQYGYGKIFLLEHETWGDETEALIVDGNARVIFDDVWNGFDDFNERAEYGDKPYYETHKTEQKGETE